MIVTLKSDFDPRAVEQRLIAQGLWVTRLDGGDRHHFLVEPRSANVSRETLLAIEGVEAVAVSASRHPRADAHPACVDVAGVRIGAEPIVIAGPCGVESEAQIHRIAAQLAGLGVRLLRGGAFKPRSSPYAFQGHGSAALEWLSDAARAAGLGVVTEVLSPADAPLVARHADLVQIGSRNMQDFALLAAAAAERRPILLKRGRAATIEDWLLAAEHCLVHGAPAVVFCERGIVGFDRSTRNVLDLGAVALLSQVYHLPVIVDPSHAVGRRDLIPALSRAALAAGAAGVMIEVHDRPGEALSDGPQALLPDDLAALVASLELSERRA
jgi:3-deoxy-7-phosphoheptulonate synthase